MAMKVTGVFTLALILYIFVSQQCVVTGITSDSSLEEQYSFSKQYFGRWYLVLRYYRNHRDIPDDIHNCLKIDITELPKNNIHDRMRIAADGIAYAFYATGQNSTSFKKEINGDYKYQFVSNYVNMEISNTGYQKLIVEISSMMYIFYRNPVCPESERQKYEESAATRKSAVRFIKDVNCNEPVSFKTYYNSDEEFPQ